MKTAKFLWFALVLMLALVFAGCEEPEDEDPVQFKVTITGTAPEFSKGKYNLWGASLLDPNNISESTATGMPDATGNNFTFYIPDNNQMPSSKFFDTFGTYLLALAESNMAGDKDGNIYIYAGEIPIEFSKNNTEINNVNWEDFITISEFLAGQNTTPVQFKLTVTDLPAANTGHVWGASLTDITMSSPQPVATGAFMGGGLCAFFEPKVDGKPDFTKPFGRDGSFIISIVQSTIAGVPDMNTMGMYMGGTGTGVAFNESDQEESLLYTDFIPLSAP